jgi:hypothetical protein
VAGGVHHQAQELLAQPIGEIRAEPFLLDRHQGLGATAHQHEPHQQQQPLLQAQPRGQEQPGQGWALKQQSHPHPEAGDVEQAAEGRESRLAAHMVDAGFPGQGQHQPPLAQAIQPPQAG